MNYVYQAYGLTIASELMLPELFQVIAEPDISVHIGAVTGLPEETDLSENYVQATFDEAVLVWKDIGAFQVRNGHEIIIQPSPEIDERLIRAFLLGSAFGILLHQRGLFTLHASAVEIAGNAVAFIGWKGYGKSTTAGALHAHGHRLLTDDIVAIGWDSSGIPIVYPGFPQLKLWPEAATALGKNVTVLPQIYPEIDKRACSVVDSFSLDAVPLKAICILGEDLTPSLSVVPPQAAFVELVAHSYALRFLKTAGTTPAHFRQCDRLLRQVPIWRLRRPYSLDALPEVVRLVEEQMATYLHLV